MHTAFTSESEVEHIALGLTDHSLPKLEWTHAAHFGAVLWLMRYRPHLDMPRDLPPLIRAYNEATGVVNSETTGYHETITLASLRAARAELNRLAPETLVYVVLNGLMVSPLGRSDWLFSYWSKSLLFSGEARKRWIEPDLRNFPY